MLLLFDWRRHMITFTTSHSTADAHGSDCLILPYFAETDFTDMQRSIDQQLGNQLSTLKQQQDLPTEQGQCRLLFTPTNPFKRLLLVCLGKTNQYTADKLQKVWSAAWQQFNGTAIKTVSICLQDITLLDRPVDQHIRLISEIWIKQSYHYHDAPSKHAPVISQVVFTDISQQQQSICQQQLHYATKIGYAVNQARQLGNMPPNQCTPTYLAEQAQAFGKQHEHVTTEILSEQQMTEIGMGALLSIGQGSAEPSQFIILRYQGHPQPEASPYVFVGKGVTFDTGGISLKTRLGMRDMKLDMCGAAAVFSAFCAAVELKLPINLVTLIASVENMPGGGAVKVSDVVTGLSGKTIEILNTDAEGRVILSDALTYSERFEPQSVIDVATLTGAIGVALGHYRTGLYSNHPSLSDALVTAANTSQDLVWPMPLDAVYRQYLKSDVADIKNISDGAQPGSIIGATFLSAFAEKLKWAHLDMGGSALKNHNATGRCTALLVQYLINEVAAPS